MRSGQSTCPFLRPDPAMAAMMVSCSALSVHSLTPSSTGSTQASASLAISGLVFIFLWVYSSLSNSGSLARKSTISGRRLSTSVRLCVSSAKRRKSNLPGSSTFSNHGVAKRKYSSKGSLRMYSALNQVSFCMSNSEGDLFRPSTSKISSSSAMV